MLVDTGVWQQCAYGTQPFATLHVLLQQIRQHILQRSGVMGRRLMELLAPLARRSRIVTALLANEMGVLGRLLSVISDPLTLSLGP